MVLKNIFHALNYPFKEVFFYIGFSTRLFLEGYIIPEQREKKIFLKKECL